MSVLKTLASGLIGSATLTAVHQGAQRLLPNAPHVDAIGRRAVSRGIRALGGTPPRGRQLHNTALVGDLVSNALYYGLMDVGRPRHRVARGALLGLVGGLGAVFLPQRLGLGRQPHERWPRTPLMTVAWYTLGGVASGAVRQLLDRR
jgi:hypothetical protein